MDELAERVAAVRQDLSTVRGVATITQDRAALEGAWRAYVARHAAGSLAQLSSRPSTSRLLSRFKGNRDPSSGADIQPFLDQVQVTPERVTSSFERALPDRWRVTTEVEGSADQSILVISGPRWWTTAGPGPNDDRVLEEHVPVLHASIATMLDPSDLLRRLMMTPVSGSDRDHPGCLRLRGIPRDPDDLAVWPGETYGLCLDEQNGVLLDFASFHGAARVAGTSFSNVEFNVSLEPERFDLDPGSGARWRQLDD